ncbi:O-antigen ligase family protein [Pseudoalteromonas sp. Angola-7]|uniref:O-antigen ligase family protein n=1 Tax=Pseudoalteromonas sp. Angola-7 TaxID=3025336 RepID=UPI0023586CA9|nr:O-antigen ligase family protein [Pseudoalteromonas sp. Angola-7]MDC9529393.1 O-antigen ligase family protein [Pseudoalteromonas sp. Angola-7]
MLSIKVKQLQSVLFLISAMVIPLYFTDFRFNAGGLILRLSDILSLCMISIFLLLLFNNKISLKYPIGFNYIIAFLIYCFFKAYVQVGLSKALIATIQWILILSTLMVVYINALKNPSKFRFVFIKTLLIICFITVAYHVLHGQIIRYKLLGDARYVFALTGVVLISCAYYFEDKSYLKPLFFLYPVILLSLERKGILAFHMVAFFYIFINLKPLLRSLIIGFFSFSFFVFAIAYDLSFIDSFTFFEYSEFDMLYLDEEKAVWTSNLHRQSLLTNGWDIFTNNFFFGVGPKMLPSYMSNYYINDNLALYTHNVFLDTLIEQGVTGMLLLLLPYFVYIFKARELKLGKTGDVFIALCIYSIFMIFFMSGGSPSMILLYFPLFKGFVVHK